MHRHLDFYKSLTTNKNLINNIEGRSFWTYTSITVGKIPSGMTIGKDTAVKYILSKYPSYTLEQSIHLLSMWKTACFPKLMST